MNTWKGMSPAREYKHNSDFKQVFLGRCLTHNSLQHPFNMFDIYYYYKPRTAWIVCIPCNDLSIINSNLNLVDNGETRRTIESASKDEHIIGIRRIYEAGLIAHPDYPQTYIIEGISYADFGINTTPRPA